MDAETYADVRRLMTRLALSVAESTDRPELIAAEWERMRRALKAIEAGHVAIDHEVDEEIEDAHDHLAGLADEESLPTSGRLRIVGGDSPN